jgi:hypothetical protein
LTNGRNSPARIDIDDNICKNCLPLVIDLDMHLRFSTDYQLRCYFDNQFISQEQCYIHDDNTEPFTGGYSYCYKQEAFYHEYVKNLLAEWYKRFISSGHFGYINKEIAFIVINICSYILTDKYLKIKISC